MLTIVCFQDSTPCENIYLKAVIDIPITTDMYFLLE